MTWPELKPITAPLRCFGLEHNGADPICVACPHRTECQRYMGSRLNRIPLSKAVFHILPEAYQLRFNTDEDDPDVPQLQRVYILCYETVFGRKPDKFNLGLSAGKIASNARRANCSVRLFILANMIGHQRMEKERIAKMALARTTIFTPWRLTDSRALERARLYAELCRKEFGTFTLSTLSTLSETPALADDLEARMLNSEVYVGRWLVGYKMRHEGQPYSAMYVQLEPDLDPHWLATEDSYKTLILDVEAKKGSQQQRSQRHAASQVIGFLKRHPALAGVTFSARQNILPAAVNKVLEYFNYRPEDFEIENKPITNPLEMWVTLGRALLHWNLVKYLRGDSSIFDQR